MHKQNFRRFWITLPKINLNENFWPKGHLTETPFDRNTIWPNTVRPNAIWPKKVILPKTKFIKRLFDRKYLENSHLTENGYLTENSFDRMLFFEKCLLTEYFFRKMSIWKKTFSTKGKTNLIHHFNRKSFSHFWICIRPE
jgi:hypothetical protein